MNLKKAALIVALGIALFSPVAIAAPSQRIERISPSHQNVLSRFFGHLFHPGRKGYAVR